MFCPNCGSQLADGSQFCPYCNSALAPQQNQNPAAQNSNTYYQNGSGAAYPVQGTNNGPINDPRGMKWFKFIIYFQLFANAVVNVVNAFRLFTGSHYGEEARLVYAFFPSLKTVDILIGICFLALAAFAIFVRQRLAGFFTNGPKLYYAVLIANIAVGVLYLILTCSVTGLSLGDVIDSSTISSLIVNVVMLVVNKIYFDKRADLFRN